MGGNSIKHKRTSYAVQSICERPGTNYKKVAYIYKIIVDTNRSVDEGAY
jgi:hypothetical protein